MRICNHITNTDGLRKLLHVTAELKKIAKTLHKLDEGWCNGYVSLKAEHSATTREKNLENRARDLANSIGFSVFHQSDPRGATLYLFRTKDLPKDRTIEECYTNFAACIY